MMSDIGTLRLPGLYGKAPCPARGFAAFARGRARERATVADVGLSAHDRERFLLSDSGVCHRFGPFIFAGARVDFAPVGGGAGGGRNFADQPQDLRRGSDSDAGPGRKLADFLNKS
jgi:hypothetical protein